VRSNKVEVEIMASMMWDRLEELERRYEALSEELARSDVAVDPARLRDLGRKHAELHEIVSAFRDCRRALAQAQDARSLIKDEKDHEMVEFLRGEEAVAEDRVKKLEAKLEGLLVPRDPNDDRDVVVEIRAGTGGQEAALFAADLFEMYRRFAERNRWRSEVLSSSPSDHGGFKEIVLEIRGPAAYSRLKHESGVHRVQRVPVTESGGRIHTSTATVAVLPEAEEVEVHIDPDDLDIDVFRSSGPGGQSVNTTDSAVRVTHRPTGIVIAVQEERSQRQNKEKALRYLRARLLKRAEEEQARNEAAARRAQVGTGERSEKIRTYNFPQNRVTDHRVNVSVHEVPLVLGGNLEPFVEALMADERRRQLTGDGPALQTPPS
jgi:peptide chain release factor 1